MSAAEAARRLVDVRADHPVVSFYLDLDPERFATPPARATLIRSLLDEARREVEQERELAHDDLQALRGDLERIEAYLQSDNGAFQGARALAIFCSIRDDLFEVVQLARGVESRVLIERTPYIEPLVRVGEDRRWCVALVSRRAARVLSGPADRLEERQRIEDNFERSLDAEAHDHLRRVAAMLSRRWSRERYDRLALGGPVEAVSQLESFLHADVRALLTERRVDVDVANSSEEVIRSALARLAEEDERERERAALDRLAASAGAAAATDSGTAGHAAVGVEATRSALEQRRVETLLLASDFDPPDHLREAMIEAALTQDAAVLGIRHYSDLGPVGGVAALLRF